VAPNPFTADEIAAEERRPKRKVAVLIGYAGTGYKGMQINHREKTVEGDIFAAFVAAGAISKANADDPKKSSLARCARTDKGVHAAGNVISLKLIIEDPDVIDRINAHLPPQIRIWGIQRTTNSFNCYQSCESRWYEYLLPSHALLPPSPKSFLWKKCVEAARETGTYDEFEASLRDVWDFWPELDEKHIKPILEALDPETLATVLERLKLGESTQSKPLDDEEEPPIPAVAPSTSAEQQQDSEPAAGESSQAADAETNGGADGTERKGWVPGPVDFALRDIKQATIAAKRRYRISPGRLQQLQAALDKYVGTNNFHNYTVQKSFRDSSSKRLIRSFVVNPTTIIKNDTEWLSLKVHGQSFMMHQIRKMVSVASLVVRCATPLSRMEETYGNVKIAIPKAPGLGLWLERPVFEGYNRHAAAKFEREMIDFEKHDEKIQEFKDREIFSRIYNVEHKQST
jgi:tRNA pseudouridine38-40 synthase